MSDLAARLVVVTGSREWVVQAYRFALDPTAGQADALAGHCHASRKAFNVMLGAVQANLGQRAAERSYGLSGAGLTPALNWSSYALRREWNRRKHETAPWWHEYSKEAYASGCANLAAALGNWNAARQGQRAGQRTGFPRFRSRHRSRLSCKRGLNRSLADASLGRLTRLLVYKTTWYGSALIKADRWYPSSKTCSSCCTVKAKLELHERTYRCEHCGLVLDRDLNAAINLARYALAEARRMGVIAPGGSGPLDSGGASRKTTPQGLASGNEAATRTGGNSPAADGTATSQEVAA